MVWDSLDIVISSSDISILFMTNPKKWSFFFLPNWIICCFYFMLVMTEFQQITSDWNIGTFSLAEKFPWGFMKRLNAESWRFLSKLSYLKPPPFEAFSFKNFQKRNAFCFSISKTFDSKGLKWKQVAEAPADLLFLKRSRQKQFYFIYWCFNFDWWSFSLTITFR